MTKERCPSATSNRHRRRGGKLGAMPPAPICQGPGGRQAGRPGHPAVIPAAGDSPRHWPSVSRNARATRTGDCLRRLRLCGPVPLRTGRRFSVYFGLPAPKGGGLLMSTNQFRRLAAKIDQQMQQFAAEGAIEAWLPSSIACWDTCPPWTLRLSLRPRSG